MRKLMMAVLGAMLLAVGTYVAYAAITGSGPQTEVKLEAVSNDQPADAKADCSYAKSKSSAYSSEECATRAERSGCLEKKQRSGCGWEEDGHEVDAEPSMSLR